MKKFLTPGCIAMAAMIMATPPAAEANTPVDFARVKITDNFWAPRLHNHAATTVATCIDQIENKTGRMRNFEQVANGGHEHSGIFFDDSDVYKAIEGMAYTLINNPDQALEDKTDEWIDKIAAAQDKNGYINTFYTLAKPNDRWTDMDKHEMYCAGHLIEAGVAYYKATGKDKLLNVGRRMADHMMDVFGPGKRHWVPGHQEIELALCKLADTTGEKKYVDFAKWLLDERGHGIGVRLDIPWDPKFYQDLTPVAELTDISGHAVRCMYMYSGMADVMAATGENAYMDALHSLWHDVVDRNMYITGGIGSSYINEGFTVDYDMPNLDAYCETCASIGMALWNQRMNTMEPDSKYVDVVERCIYNGILSGVSLSGTKFFYVNPLESRGDHHRQEWYGCACCPSNVCRFLPSLGGYIYGVSPETIWVNLYIGSEAAMPDGKWTVNQTTSYPYDGSVALTLAGPEDEKRDIRMRVPGWCDSYKVRVNGKAVKAPVEKGYLVLSGCGNGDRIDFDMDMPVKINSADTRVAEDLGKRAITRGPLVYCVEECDNASTYDLGLKVNGTELSVGEPIAELNGAVSVLASVPGGNIRMIPYFCWDNRKAGRMKVWLDYKN